MGIPPTGKQVAVTGMVISRFAAGKVVEDWEIFDQMGLLQQLGVVPTPGQAGG
jgi:predicted ester cyclase